MQLQLFDSSTYYEERDMATKEERLAARYPAGWELRSRLYEAAGNRANVLVPWTEAREIANGSCDDQYKTAWVRLSRMQNVGLIKIVHGGNGRPLGIKVISTARMAVDK